MDKQLQKYDCAPSQTGKEWAQNFWKDKAIIWAVFEAQLSYMQKGVKESFFSQIYRI